MRPDRLIVAESDILSSWNAVLPRFMVDYRIYIYNFSTNQFKTFVSGAHQKPITHLLKTKDNQFLISVSKDKTLKIWDIDNIQLIKTIEVKSSVTSLVQSENGQLMFSCDDGSLHFEKINELFMIGDNLSNQNLSVTKNSIV